MLLQNENKREDKSKQENKPFAEMTYNGQPIPKWLQEPAYKLEPEHEQDELPKWLKEPVHFT